MITISAITVACILFVASYISIKKEPRRILNGFLLETGLIFLIGSWITVLYVRAELFLAVLPVYTLYIGIFALGIILILNFFTVIRKEGKSIPNVLPLFFGIISIIVAISGYQAVIIGMSGSMLYVKIMSVLYNLILYVPYAIGAVLIYSIVYLHLPKNKNVDYIIVLGCGLRENGQVTPLLKGRLDKAIEWYNRGNQRAKFIVSGGKGSDEIISEAEAMRNYLLSQNIPQDKIIIENKSVNTKENLLFSKRCMNDDNRGDSAIICTSNYHVLRTVILARAINIDAQGIGGHTALYYLPVAFFREYIAMIFRYKALIIVYLAFAIVKGLFF